MCGDVFLILFVSLSARYFTMHPHGAREDEQTRSNSLTAANGLSALFTRYGGNVCGLHRKERRTRWKEDL